RPREPDRARRQTPRRRPRDGGRDRGQRAAGGSRDPAGRARDPASLSRGRVPTAGGDRRAAPPDRGCARGAARIRGEAETGVDGPVSAPAWYFAYGSNMSRAIFCERRGMCPTVSRWGVLDGFRLCFDLPIGPGERGVANVVPEPGARTFGVLHLLTPTELDRLDRTEGVHVG